MCIYVCIRACLYRGWGGIEFHPLPVVDMCVNMHFYTCVYILPMRNMWYVHECMYVQIRNDGDYMLFVCVCV